MKIKAESLSKTYNPGINGINAVKQCSFEIDSGERISIVGASGSGKSTLLYLLSGLERETSGTIKYDDIDFSRLSDTEKADFRIENIGIVFQSFNLLPELTAYENIILPIMMQGKKIDTAYTDMLIQKLGISDRKEHLSGQLSGGQQQRVAIARALVNRPSILLCDEPTGNLDSTNSKAVIKLLFDMSKEFNNTLIVVTHDRNIAEKFDKNITISDGILKW